MFCVKNESITFKARRDHLLPVEVEDIFLVNVEENANEVAEHAIVASLKRKKVKSTWVKQYLYGTKYRKWGGSPIPRTTHQGHDQ
ncbi:hypothetical protein HAX54_037020, partial [Datura stramonium]|nr:hypothetical protein [Datura stramonium]